MPASGKGEAWGFSYMTENYLRGKHEKRRKWGGASVMTSGNKTKVWYHLPGLFEFYELYRLPGYYAVGITTFYDGADLF